MTYLITKRDDGKKFLENKVAIVTGASGNIGLAICRALLENGASVNAFCNKGKDKIERLKKQYKNIECFELDFLSENFEEKIHEAVKRIHDTHKKLDILINVAGIWVVTPFLYEAKQQREKIWRINYEAALAFSKNTVRCMIGKPGIKNIINIVSTAGVKGVAQQISYSSSKAALVNLTEALAEEFANYGINVNAVSPGPVESDAIKQYIPDEKAKRLWAKSIPKYSLCKIEDVVNACLGILMNEYLTGANIVLHGGRI